MTSVLSADALEAIRVAPATTYAEQKASSEARVARWVWATGPFYSLQPLAAECGGWSRGRLCKGTPQDVSKKYEFGLDEAGRLCVIREHTEVEGGCHETFVEARDGEWVWRYQDGNKSKPLVVRQMVYENDQLVAMAVKSRRGHTVERFDWHNGRVRTIVVESKNGTKNTYEVSYKAGLLSEVSFLPEGAEPEVVFTAKPPNLKALLEAMQARLPAAVHQRVAEAKESRPVFCLALSYSQESREEMALPMVSLGLESDRERWRPSGASPAELWNPASFSTFDSDALELDDAELGELAREIALGLRAPKDYAAVKKTYLAVAKALADIDWQACLAPAADFKVLAVDVDVSDLKKNFKAIIGAAAFKELQKSGLI